MNKMRRVFGIVSLVVAYPFFLLVIVFPRNQDRLSAFFTCTAFYFVLEFFLGKVIIIDDQHITVVALLNPFKKRLRLPLKDVTAVTVRSGSRGVTTIYFDTPSKRHEVGCSWIGFDTNRMIKMLSKAGITIETYDS